MQPDDLVAIHHMLECALEAISMLAARSGEDLREDRVRDLALQQLISMIGNAAVAVSTEGRARCPEVPWQRTINDRDRMVHDYDTVDQAIVWGIVTDALPPLAAALQRAQSEEERR